MLPRSFPIQFSDSNLANAPPPGFLAERGAVGFCISFRRLESTEGARDAKGPGGPTGLDASRHRGLSKVPVSLPRTTGSRKSAESQGVPRAVFEVCSASPPVDFPFQATRLSFRIGRPPIHRCGPRRGRQTFDRLPAPAINGAQRRAVGAPGRSGLDRRKGKLASHLRRPHPATAPRAQRLETLIKRPSVAGHGMCGI